MIGRKELREKEFENGVLMINSSVLGANAEYVKQTREYGKTDVMLALTLYGFMLLEFMLLGKLFIQKGDSLTNTYLFLLQVFLHYYVLELF